jgi:hypothetical protein
MKISTKNTHFQKKEVDVENTLKSAFYTLRELSDDVKDERLALIKIALSEMIADEQEGKLK